MWIYLLFSLHTALPIELACAGNSYQTHVDPSKCDGFLRVGDTLLPLWQSRG